MNTRYSWTHIHWIASGHYTRKSLNFDQMCVASSWLLNCLYFSFTDQYEHQRTARRPSGEILWIGPNVYSLSLWNRSISPVQQRKSQHREWSRLARGHLPQICMHKQQPPPRVLHQGERIILIGPTTAQNVATMCCMTGLNFLSTQLLPHCLEKPQRFLCIVCHCQCVPFFEGGGGAGVTVFRSFTWILWKFTKLKREKYRLPAHCCCRSHWFY